MISKQTTRANKGQVGIGTLIVFIAIVLVAAVVASVLISVVEIISDRGTDTAIEGVEEVGDKVIVTGVFGAADGDGEEIESVRVNVRRAAGAGIIDMDAALIDYADESDQFFLVSEENEDAPGGINDDNEPDANTGTYDVNALVDDSGGLEESPRALDTLQDRAEVFIDLDAGDDDSPPELDPGENIDLSITTPSGAETIQSAQVPASFNENEVVRLDR